MRAGREVKVAQVRLRLFPPPDRVKPEPANLTRSFRPAVRPLSGYQRDTRHTSCHLGLGHEGPHLEAASRVRVSQEQRQPQPQPQPQRAMYVYHHTRKQQNYVTQHSATNHLTNIFLLSKM